MKRISEMEGKREGGREGDGGDGDAAEIHAALKATKETCLLTLIQHATTGGILRGGGVLKGKRVRGAIFGDMGTKERSKGGQK